MTEDEKRQKVEEFARILMAQRGENLNDKPLLGKVTEEVYHTWLESGLPVDALPRVLELVEERRWRSEDR
jgi:hypothetical protein